MEAQVLQYQTNQQTSERLLQSKNDEIMLKWVVLFWSKLWWIDVVTKPAFWISTEPSKVETPSWKSVLSPYAGILPRIVWVQMLLVGWRECSRCCLWIDVQVLERVEIEGQEMCYCRLTSKSVGSFRRIIQRRLVWNIDETTEKWLQLQAVRDAFPSISKHAICQI